MSMKKKPMIPEQTVENFIFNAKDEVERKKSMYFFNNYSDITSDASINNDNTSDKNINVTKDNADDIDSDTSSDKNNDVDSDINSDNNSDIISDITITLKKRNKYTDLHERKTYYISKEYIKKIDKLSSKYNLDKSYIVNEALKLFFNSIKE